MAAAYGRSTKETKKAETALAELRGRAEAEKEGLRFAATAADERVAAVQEQVARLEQELQSYKVPSTSCCSQKGRWRLTAVTNESVER